MATSEIEKLERRYAENPQGLTFAPLAEVHRKGGDVARSLELLRAGLELHPNYIPASIVLGRCHWDLGDLPAAEAAFAHVLRLDDENVIALKSLADINERLGRPGEAQRWLQRLVSVDRSNEEARQQLMRLEQAKDQGDRKPERAPEPAASSLPHEVAAVEAEPPGAQPAAPVESSPPAAEVVEAKSSKLEFLDTSQPARSGGPDQPVTPEGSAPVDGLISQEFVPPRQASYPLHPELTQEFISEPGTPDRLDVETAEEVELQSSGTTEFRVPNAAEDFQELAARMNAAREETPLSPPRPPVEEPPAAPPRAAMPAMSGPKLVTDSEARHDRQSYSARVTKGQSVADFFKAMLAARPAGSSGPGTSASSATAGSPAPGHDALTLSPGFGGEGVTIPPAASASGQSKEAAVSFDDFFASPAGGAGPQSQRSGEPGNDDLDQFQSWLQNLKR